MHIAMLWQKTDGRPDPLRVGALTSVCAPAVWMVFMVQTGGFGPLPRIGLVYWTGVWAAALLLVTLAVSPAVSILRWPRLAGLRRLLGLAALAYTLGHVLSWMALHRLDAAALVGELLTRPTLVVATLSTLGLVALGATSWDGAVRRLGFLRWKRLHSLNLLFAGLALLHFLLSPGIFMLQFLLAGLFLWLVCWRFGRHWNWWQPWRLLVLALTVTVVTMGGEALWLWLYHNADGQQVLMENLSLEFGMTAGHWVLLVSIAGAGAAWAMKHPADTQGDSMAD